MKKLLMNASAIAILLTAKGVNAETILRLQADLAREKTIKVNVAKGQPSPIIFKTGEIIDAVKLGDMSQDVFSFNAPIDSGKTTTLNINQIEEINIPLATKAQIPIIDVETIDSNGVRQHYSFELHNNSVDRSKIFIVPEPKPEPEPKPKPELVVTTIQTSYGEASPEDVARGLELKIKEKQIDSKSEIVLAIREYIALTQNGIALAEALSSTKVPISIIQKLGEIGQKEDTKQRLMPLETDFRKL